MGLAFREGAVKKQKLLHTQKPLHWQGKEGALNLRGEHNKCMGDKVERICHRDQCQSPLPSQIPALRQRECRLSAAAQTSGIEPHGRRVGKTTVKIL